MLKLGFYKELYLYYELLNERANYQEIALFLGISVATVFRYKKDLGKGKLSLKSIQSRYSLRKKTTISPTKRKGTKLRFGEERIPKGQTLVNELSRGKKQGAERRLSPPVERGKVSRKNSAIERRILELVADRLPSYQIVSVINSEFDKVSLSRSEILPYLMKSK